MSIEKFFALLAIFWLGACSEPAPSPNLDGPTDYAAESNMTLDPAAINKMKAADEALDRAGEAVDLASEAVETAASGDTASSNERLARARGISVQEMNDPNQNYGYTTEDQAFLRAQGVSEAEARAAERVLCSKGIDC